MKAWQWHGHEFVRSETVPITDRGFRYGMALFESLRVRQGEPLFLDEHLCRLREACAQRHFPIAEEALAAVGNALRRAGEDGFARIYITGGDGMAASPPEACRVYVMLEERARSAHEAFHVGLSPELHQPLFGGLKTGNYWLNIDVLQRGYQHGKQEMLLFNEHAELISACMANVFLVHGETLSTPSHACGAREGVVRAWVKERRRVRERSLFAEDVKTASEVFITNSWLGVMPVNEVEGRTLPSHTVAEALREEYEAKVAEQ